MTATPGCRLLHGDRHGTTDPTLVGMPGDMTLTTSDPSGRPCPTRADRDRHRRRLAEVWCSPASGSTIPVGDPPSPAPRRTRREHRLGFSASTSGSPRRAGGPGGRRPRGERLADGADQGRPLLDGSAITTLRERGRIPCEGGAAVQTDPPVERRRMGHPRPTTSPPAATRSSPAPTAWPSAASGWMSAPTAPGLKPANTPDQQQPKKYPRSGDGFSLGRKLEHPCGGPTAGTRPAAAPFGPRSGSPGPSVVEPAAFGRVVP